jgi:hypothetical protein
MSMECTLLLIHHAWRGGRWASVGEAYIGTRLVLTPLHPEHAEALRKLPTEPLPGELHEALLRYDAEAGTYHDGAVTEDRYGEPLKLWRAGAVALAMAAVNGFSPTVVHEPTPASWRAALAYHAALPPDTHVVAFWH